MASNLDLSGLSDSDLKAIASGNVKMMSSKGLQIVANQSKPSQPDSILSRVGAGVMDPIDSLAQILDHSLPKSVSNGIDDFQNKVAPYSMGLVAPMPKGGMDAFINQKNANYHKPEGTDWARFGGNIISPVNLAVASKLPVAASLAGKVLTGMGTGALTSAAMTPVVGDAQKNFGQAKTDQAITGLVTGGLIPAVSGGLSRVISPNVSNNASLKLLQSEGVNPTVGQTLGGAWNKAEEKLQSVPILGDMISNARRNANTQFENAAYNRALRPVGESLPNGMVGRDALNYTEGTLKNAYDSVLNKIGAIKPDTEFASKVANLKSMVDGLQMPQAEKDKFAFALNNVHDSIDHNGVITSDAFKNLESALGRDAQKLGLSTNIYEAKISPAVKQLQAELRDMLTRQAGSSSNDLQSANTAWANFKRVQNASSKLGADNGEFTPAQFQNAVRAMDRSKDKGAFARGNALGQDLGDAGKTILGSKVPNSGTADRLFLGGGTALGSYLINPSIPLGLLTGAGLYTQPAQKAINALLTKRPEFAAPLAEKLREGSNYLLPASGAIGLGLLNN